MTASQRPTAAFQRASPNSDDAAAKRRRDLTVVAADRPNVLARTRTRVQSARAFGERRYEQAQRFSAVRAAMDSFEHEQRSGAGLLAGGLAYRFFFWLVAFGLVCAAAASFWVRATDEHTLTDAGKHFGLSGIAAHSAASAVEDGSKSRWYFLAAGVILMIYFGTGAVRALRVTAIIAWRHKPTRMRKPLRSSLIFAALFTIGLGITILASWERHQSAGLGLLATLGAVLCYAALAQVGFHLLPHPRQVGWREFVPGSLLVGAGITAIHVFVAYYLADKLERSPKLYGVLGASTVVLLGLYLIARVAVSGMFLNAALDRRSAASRPYDETDAAHADALA
jgi:uncharacterized BrkB/YihY/UPF0761 family membrane protein